MRARWAVTAVAPFGVAAICCAQNAGVESVQIVDASVPLEATTTVAGPPDVRPPDPCQHARWPDRPDASDLGVNVPPIVVAIRTINMDARPPADGGVDASAAVGLDLDYACTCPGQESCVIRDDASQIDTCDNPNGVDPVANKIVLNTIGGPAATQVIGSNNWVFRISNYNGLPDDPQVTVEVFLSLGTPPNDAGVHPSPSFDGGDVWQEWTLGVAGTLSLFSDEVAYVHDGVLVAMPGDGSGMTPFLYDLVEDAGLPLGNGDPLFLVISDLVVTATLAQASDGSYSLLDGRAGGRLATDGPQGLLMTFERFGICPGSAVYGDIQSLICNRRDIASSHLRDNAGVPCDALSFAAAFTATPARLGAPVDLAFPSICPGDDGGALACP